MRHVGPNCHPWSVRRPPLPFEDSIARLTYYRKKILLDM